ncbi:6173_t:CDS:2, partial [Entrophospora sp. SA101]
MKKLIDELYHNAILKQAKNENITMKYVLKGAGGVGKTTTLYTTACAARAAGCLVMYINAKYFTDSTDWINVKVNLFVQRWLEYTENIDLLKKIPSYLPGFISLYDVALKTANDNTGKAIQAFSALITDLRCVKHIPVIICIDQYNSFLVKHKLILEEDKPPQIVQHEYNSIANIFSDWNNFNTSQGAVLYAFTSSSHGSIPQEFMRFFKYWSEYGSEGIDVVKFQYFEDAKRYYTARIHRLLDKESLGDEFKDSAMFAAKVFMGKKTAEYSILTAFDDFHVKEVIKVLKEDNAMSLRVLELCVQHCFRMAARNVTPIGFPYTDLKTKSKLKKMIVIVKVVVVHDEIPQTLPKFNPGTFYVCWQGAAVIDFFIYSIDGTKIFLQVLELCYIEHHTKLPDLFVNGKNSLGENEYYVYLTTNNSGMKKTTGTYVEQVCLVSELLNILDEIVQGIIIFESDVPKLSQFYEWYESLENSEEDINVLIDERWEKMYNPVMLVAHLLDPRYFGRRLPGDGMNEISEFINKYFPEDSIIIYSQIMSYRAKTDNRKKIKKKCIDELGVKNNVNQYYIENESDKEENIIEEIDE